MKNFGVRRTLIRQLISVFTDNPTEHSGVRYSCPLRMRSAQRVTVFGTSLFLMISCVGTVGDGSLGLGEGEEGYVSLPPEAASEPMVVKPPEVASVDMEALKKNGINGMRPERAPIAFVGTGESIEYVPLDPNSGLAQMLKEEEAKGPKLYSPLTGVSQDDAVANGGAQ